LVFEVTRELLILVGELVLMAMFWSLLVLFVKGVLPFNRLILQAVFYDAVGYPLPYLVRGIWVGLFSFGFLAAWAAAGSVVGLVFGAEDPEPGWVAWFVGAGILLFALVLMPLFLVVSRHGKPLRFVPPEIRGLSQTQIRGVAERALKDRGSERGLAK
jgi:hypothetical protein